MRSLSILSFASFVLAGCLSSPRHAGVRVVVKTTVPAKPHARVDAQARTPAPTHAPPGAVVRGELPVRVGIDASAGTDGAAGVDTPAGIETSTGIGVSVGVDPSVGIDVGGSVEADIGAGAIVVEAPDDVLVPIEGAPVVEFFGIPLEGAQDVVFVLDRSGSMSGDIGGQLAATGPDSPAAPAPVPRKIDVAHAELVDAIERLPAGTRVNILYFNTRLDAFAPAIVALEESQRASLVQFVQRTAPIGSTALAPAMRTALLMNARRIVLLSDGLANVGGDADNVLRDAREAMRGGVRIDTIGLGTDQDRYLLEALASESGGLYQPL